MNHYTPTTLPARTPTDWDAIARAHLAAIGNGGFTPCQDWELWTGLMNDVGIIPMTRAIGKTPADIGARFHAITEPFKVGDLRHVPIEAQEALVRALRGRLS